MASKISDKNKKDFTKDLLSTCTADEKSSADEHTSNLSKLWKKKYVQEWKDNWDDISHIFKYSYKVRKCVFENIVFKDFNKSLYNTKISDFEDLEKSIRKIVEDSISTNYHSSVFDWENVLKEIKEKKNFK